MLTQSSSVRTSKDNLCQSMACGDIRQLRNE
jgi:hypothetical protein